MAYDSFFKTMAHIERVRDLLMEMIVPRAYNHDSSKLDTPEKEYFDEYIPKLDNTTYGSDEYYDCLKGMKVALDHHYKYNRHHPEHFVDGMQGMNLIDMIEMLADWKAASERGDTSFYQSLIVNRDRYNISPEMFDLIYRTAVYMQWIVEEHDA